MRRIVFALIVSVVFLAVGCRSGGTGGASGVASPPFIGEAPQEAYVYKGETGTYGGMLVLSIPDDIQTYNIIRATDTPSADVLWLNVYRCLVDYRNGGDPPDYDAGLSTRWETSPDAKTWTFYIRRGVRWSDGEPFTADDVVFSYDVIKDEKVDTAGRDVFVEGKGEDGKPLYPELEKIDDHTVRFKLNNPNGSFLDAIFNLWLIPKHKWEAPWREGKFKETMQLSDDPATVVGLGPFRVKEYASGQRVVLERNPYFWKVDSKGQRLPYLDRIVYVIAKDFNTVQAKFEAGEIDVMTRVRAQDYALVKRLESPGIKVEDIGVSYDTNWMVLNLNNGNDPKTGKPYVAPWKQRLFRDQRFRQAVSYAIDREALANTVYGGRAVPVYSFVTPGDKYWYADDVMKYPHDAAQARKLLAEIGLKDGNGDGVLEDADGNAVEFNVNTNASNSQRTETANLISQNLKEVGIKANLAPVTMSVIGQALQANFNFDAVVLGWQVNPPPGPTNSKNILLSSGLNHVSFPSQKTPSTEWEARADKLMNDLERTPDAGERRRLYGDVQRIWAEYLPEINLVAQLEAVAYKNKFGNLKPSSLPPRATWNCEEIYVK